MKDGQKNVFSWKYQEVYSKDYWCSGNYYEDWDSWWFDLSSGGCWSSDIKPNFPMNLISNLVKCNNWLWKNPEVSSNATKSINLFLILFVASTNGSIIRESSLYFSLYQFSYVVIILKLIYIQQIHVCLPQMLLIKHLLLYVLCLYVSHYSYSPGTGSSFARNARLGKKGLFTLVLVLSTSRKEDSMPGIPYFEWAGGMTWDVLFICVG